MRDCTISYLTRTAHTYRIAHTLFIQHSVTLLLLALVLGSLEGCGYTLVGAPAHPAAAPVGLAVLSFVNRTHEPELESRLTAALRSALIGNQAFRLTSSASAQQYLQGIVRQFRTYPVAFDADDNALQYRLEADVFIRLVDETSQRTILEQEISPWAEYLTSTSRDVREEVVAREAAMFLLAQRFARMCTDLLTITRL
jgi:hypothetical protein